MNSSIFSINALLLLVLNSPKKFSEPLMGSPLLSYWIVSISMTKSPLGSPSGSTLASKQCPVLRRTPPISTELENQSMVSGVSSTSNRLLIVIVQPLGTRIGWRWYLSFFLIWLFWISTPRSAPIYAADSFEIAHRNTPQSIVFFISICSQIFRLILEQCLGLLFFRK